MKQLLHLLKGTTLPLIALAFAIPASGATLDRSNKDDVFKFAPKSRYEIANNGKPLSFANQKAKSNKKSAKVISDSDLKYNLNGYSVGYLDAPDGSTWYYSEEVEYTETELEGGVATKKDITKYTFTVYDSNHKLVGKLSDDVVLGDNETGTSAIQIGACVTQKFFNSDSKYEVMVMIAANTPEYENHIYTKVYSLGDGTEDAIETIDNSYYVNAVNIGTYSEKFYITFYQEGWFKGSEYDSIEDLGYTTDEAVYGLKYEIYGPKTWSSDNEVLLKTLYTPYDLYEGSDGLPFLGVAHENAAYFGLAYFEKPYFTNPSIVIDPDTGEMSRDTTPNSDNKFVIDLYKANYSGLAFESTTKIPMELKDETGTTCSFYELGILNYDDDISFDTWTKDGKPSFVVTIDDYITNSDESEYAFEVYNISGEKIAEISKNVSSMVDVSDLPGFEHQQGFYKTVDDKEIFEFVDMPSCRVANTIAVAQDDGNSITAICDRYPHGDSYQYAISMSYGITDDDDNTSHYINWYNSDGTFDHSDIIPLGKNIAMAQPYIKLSVLNPYLFNTDDTREYMLLIKRYVGSGTETAESLIITNTNGDILTELTGSEELGSLYFISLITKNAEPTLWLLYYNDTTDEYNAAFLDLPFSKFAEGGDGSASNPYLISTIGDLQQVQSNLLANYKVVNDIDASDYIFKPIPGSFKGTINGNGHIISNLYIKSADNQGILQQLNGSGVVKNLVIRNATLPVSSSSSAAGVIAGEANGDGTNSPVISNVHIENLAAYLTDDEASNVGGIVGKMSLGAKLTDSSVTGAEFDVDNLVGGLVSDIRTSSIINNCAFSGNITGSSYVGGIVAKITTGDETVSNNHVNANLQGTYLVGGVAGYAKRATISNNYVSGNIVATGYEPWGAGAEVGGVVGGLEGNWTADTKAVVTNNVVSISSIETAEDPNEAEWDNQKTTVHRIVGYTQFNDQPTVKGGVSTALSADSGIINNYSVGSLAAVDSNIEASENTTEGATLSESEFTEEFLSAQGFNFGENASKPWQLIDGNNLILYYEEGGSSGVNDVTVASTQIKQGADSINAEGYDLTIYNIAGIKVASSANSVATANLASGVYIVTAAQNGKVVSTVKLVIK